MKRSHYVLALLLSACAHGNPNIGIPSGLVWTERSVERRAIVQQIYRHATDRLIELSRGKPAGSWAVIVDTDAGTLDDVGYMQMRASKNLPYTDANWNAYILSHTLPAMPGAVAFVAKVHELGGRVVVVTNHDESICEATRANYRAVEMPVDEVICKQDTSDKNPRFKQVAAKLEVLMFIGDNINDFPGMSQSATEGFEHFGRDWFLIPNPTYGSWE